MSETGQVTPPAPAPGGTSGEPARMGPMARFFNVFLSPGAVFEDIRRNAAGWWVPVIILVLVTAVFTTMYVAKYDLSLVMKEQLKDSAGMKLVAGLAGPRPRDKAIEMAVKQVESTPAWQMQATYWVNVLLGITVMVWFFTFLYSVIALAMGWLGAAKTRRLWVNLGIFAATAVGFLIVSAVLQIVRGAAVKAAGGDAAGELPPAPAWIAVGSLLVALAATGVVLWSLSKLAREGVFGRILGAVSYGFAPSVLASLLGIVIVMIKTPDATPFEELVPANLTALVPSIKQTSAVLATIGSSLGLFAIWSTILTILGIAKALGRPMGQAAAVVLVPWFVYFFIRVLFAAIFG